MIQRSQSVPATSVALETLRSFLAEFWAEQQLPAESLFPFELSLEEIFINVVSYGAAPGTTMPPVEVKLEFDGQRVTLTCTDHGVAFDPLQKCAPDLDAKLEDRPVGGLGIFLVREFMDEVHYERANSANVLRISRRVSPG